MIFPVDVSSRLVPGPVLDCAVKMDLVAPPGMPNTLGTEGQVMDGVGVALASAANESDSAERNFIFFFVLAGAEGGNEQRDKYAILLLLSKSCASCGNMW